MEMVYFVTVKYKEGKTTSDELDEIALSEFNSLGKVEFDIDEAKVDEILGKDAYCGGDIPEHVLEKLQRELSLEGLYKYFWNKKDEAEAFLEKVKELGLDGSIDEKEGEDWNQSWRESFKTIPVSNELSVVPSWEKVEDDKSKVFIYPGMGFGTGNHETTFLCLSLFEKIKNELGSNTNCLDFGCGSGILGIAALKKNRMVVDFVDIDTNALDNCVMNLEFNDFESYQTGHGIILRDRFKADKKYELVFANILENILILEKEPILKSIKENGYLIVSGLLADQENTILNEYNSLNHIETVKKGDWIAILFKDGAA